MRAARCHDRNDIRIADIAEPEPEPEPELKPRTAAIDVAWCGIGGRHPHPISGESAPVTMGHEFSGTITALGEAVTDLSVGENVVVEPCIISEDVDTSEGAPYQLPRT